MFEFYFLLNRALISFQKKNIVSEWDGESLDISKISRLDMGAYLCIAANGVPPTVSKRIKVSVDCEYIPIYKNIFIMYLSTYVHIVALDNKLPNSNFSQKLVIVIFC